ncbi:MAG: hypothetical protein K5924_03400 [Chloroflexi bacterium]|nr:hypothetical protein [Chloroflexota bacterium]
MSGWRALVTTVLGTAAAASFGAAASLALSTGSLGFATVATPRCTTTAMAVTPALTATTISSVTVGAVPSACGGATLNVTADDGTSAASGTAVIPGGGGTVSVALTGAASLLTSVRVDLVIVGP